MLNQKLGLLIPFSYCTLFSYRCPAGFHRIHKRPLPQYKSGYGLGHPKVAHQQASDALERASGRGCLDCYLLPPSAMFVNRSRMTSVGIAVVVVQLQLL